MCFNMAPPLRIELRPTESKSVVLPLHHEGTFGTQIFKEQGEILSHVDTIVNPLKQKTLRFSSEGFGK